MRAPRLLDAMLALYPPWWRTQYRDEVRTVSLDLMADGRPALRVSANLFVGAVRTRVRGVGTPRHYEPWARRTRASLVVATLPLMMVVPIIYTFRQGQQDEFPATRHGALPFGPLDISPAGHLVYDAFAVMALALVLGVSTLIWGYANLAGAIRREGRNGRRLRRLMRLPAIAAAIATLLWVSGIIVAPHEWLTRHGVLQPLNGHLALSRGLNGAAAAVLAVGFLAAIIMLVMVSRQGHLSLADLNSGKWGGVTTTGLLWVMASAALISVVALWRQGSPHHASYSIVTTAWGSWWIAGALTLVGAAVVSTCGTVQAARALRVASQLSS